MADGRFFIAYLDTATYTASKVDSATYATALTGAVVTNANAKKTNAYETTTIGGDFFLSGGPGYVGAKFGIILDSGTTRTGSQGAYVFTFQVTPLTTGAANGTPVNVDVTFTLSASAATTALTGATAIDPSKSTAYLNAGTETTTAADASINVEATADNTTH